MKYPARILVRLCIHQAIGFTRVAWLFALYLALVFTVSDDFRPVVIIAYLLITLAEVIFLRHLRTLVHNVHLLGAKYWWSGGGVLCWCQALRWHCTVLPDTITLGAQTLPLSTKLMDGYTGPSLCLSCRPTEADADLVGFGNSVGEALADLRQAYQDLLYFMET